jgi:hypothetical protein
VKTEMQRIDLTVRELQRGDVLVGSRGEVMAAPIETLSAPKGKLEVIIRRTGSDAVRILHWGARTRMSVYRPTPVKTKADELAEEAETIANWMMEGRCPPQQAIEQVAELIEMAKAVALEDHSCE